MAEWLSKILSSDFLAELSHSAFSHSASVTQPLSHSVGNFFLNGTVIMRAAKGFENFNIFMIHTVYKGDFVEKPA